MLTAAIFADRFESEGASACSSTADRFLLAIETRGILLKSLLQGVLDIAKNTSCDKEACRSLTRPALRNRVLPRLSRVPRDIRRCENLEETLDHAANRVR